MRVELAVAWVAEVEGLADAADDGEVGGVGALGGLVFIPQGGQEVR